MAGMFQHSLRDMIGGIRAHAEAEAAYVQNAVVPAVRKEAKAPDPRMKVRPEGCSREEEEEGDCGPPARSGAAEGPPSAPPRIPPPPLDPPRSSRHRGCAGRRPSPSPRVEVQGGLLLRRGEGGPGLHVWMAAASGARD